MGVREGPPIGLIGQCVSGSKAKSAVSERLVVNVRVLDDNKEVLLVRCHHDLVLFRSYPKEREVVLAEEAW